MHSDLIITYSLVLLQSSEIIIRLGPKLNLDWDQHLSLTIDCQKFTITVDISLLLITTWHCSALTAYMKLSVFRSKSDPKQRVNLG